MFFLKELPDQETLLKFKEKYPTLDVENMNIFLNLLKVASLFMRELDNYFATHALSTAKFLALIVIRRSESKYLTMTQVSEQMGVSKKNTSRLLSSLESGGYIHLEDCSRDRRVKIITISALGDGKLENLLEGYYALINKHFETFSTKQKNELLESLFLLHPKKQMEL